jgi:hypothetical protein
MIGSARTAPNTLAGMGFLVPVMVWLAVSKNRILVQATEF